MSISTKANNLCSWYCLQIHILAYFRWIEKISVGIWCLNYKCTINVSSNNNHRNDIADVADQDLCPPKLADSAATIIPLCTRKFTPSQGE